MKKILLFMLFIVLVFSSICSAEVHPYKNQLHGFESIPWKTPFSTLPAGEFALLYSFTNENGVNDIYERTGKHGCRYSFVNGMFYHVDICVRGYFNYSNFKDFLFNQFDPGEDVVKVKSDGTESFSETMWFGDITVIALPPYDNDKGYTIISFFDASPNFKSAASHSYSEFHYEIRRLIQK